MLKFTSLVNRNRFDLHEEVLKIKKIVLLLFVTTMSLVACQQPAESTTEDDKINIVTTFYPVYEFTKQVVGNNANVSMLVGAGQDSHSFEPTPKEMITIAEADVFIYSTSYMETWVSAVLNTINGSDVMVIEAAEDIPLFEEVADSHEHEDHKEEEAHDDHNDHGHSHAIDPHVWVDPILAQELVEKISNGVQAVDPEHAATYAENAAAYQTELAVLDEEFQAAFESADDRIFVVQHAAFGYLARRYDLQEVSISSLTSSLEISPAQMAEVGRFIEDNEIQTIFYQDSVNAKLAETLAEETGADLALLSTIESVTEEDLAQGVNYLSLMRRNLESLKTTIK